MAHLFEVQFPLLQNGHIYCFFQGSWGAWNTAELKTSGIWDYKNNAGIGYSIIIIIISCY